MARIEYLYFVLNGENEKMTVYPVMSELCRISKPTDYGYMFEVNYGSDVKPEWKLYESAGFVAIVDVDATLSVNICSNLENFIRFILHVSTMIGQYSKAKDEPNEDKPEPVKEKDSPVDLTFEYTYDIKAELSKIMDKINAALDNGDKFAVLAKLSKRYNILKSEM